jgi:hypothetical protein
MIVNVIVICHIEMIDSSASHEHCYCCHIEMTNVR